MLMCSYVIRHFLMNRILSHHVEWFISNKLKLKLKLKLNMERWFCLW